MHAVGGTWPLDDFIVQDWEPNGYSPRCADCTWSRKDYFAPILGRMATRARNFTARDPRNACIRPRTLLDMSHRYPNCFYCGVNLDWSGRGRAQSGTGTFDHYIPLSHLDDLAGAWNSVTNLVTCCTGCNSSKRDKHPSELQPHK